MPSATDDVSAQSSSPFVKQLASSNRHTRDRALTALRVYLQRGAVFTELDFLKLWKGLFYCMFMSDKPRTQQQLARDLAALVDVLANVPSTTASAAEVRSQNTLGFFDAFWKTMGREWSGIDSLRMDKFLYLVRCYVAKGFEVCVFRDSGALAKEYLANLRKPGSPFSPKDVKVSNGLRLHVLDVWVDELEKADQEKEVDLDLVLEPIRRLGKETLVKSVRERVQETLEDDRLQNWDGRSESEDTGNSGRLQVDDDKDDDGEEGFGGFDD